ncbi:MAG: REDY-like protein HapK [Pseudomonadota bacterium]
MTVRIIALFNLKPGVTVDDYEKWAKTVDIPTVNGLGSIARFEVFRATGLLGSEDAPPYEYIEIIDVDDMDGFGKDVASETMQKVAAEFQGQVDDLSFIMTDKVG